MVLDKVRFRSLAVAIEPVPMADLSDQLRVVAETMANPEGTQAREPYQNFDEEGLPS